MASQQALGEAATSGLTPAATSGMTGGKGPGFLSRMVGPQWAGRLGTVGKVASKGTGALSTAWLLWWLGSLMKEGFTSNKLTPEQETSHEQSKYLAHLHQTESMKSIRDPKISPADEMVYSLFDQVFAGGNMIPGIDDIDSDPAAQLGMDPQELMALVLSDQSGEDINRGRIAQSLRGQVEDDPRLASSKRRAARNLPAPGEFL